jgi:pantoate kinase
MSETTKAFAPGNISCIFKIHEDRNPEKTGSSGLGFTLNTGVTIEAALSDENEVYFNNKSINLPTIKSVVKKLSPTQKVKINITSNLPLGSGFGISGASALAATYALNSLLDLKYTNTQLAKIAHISEVENRTGLGDVTNQYIGGFLLKLLPSSKFIAEKIPLDDITVYCKYFSQISTKEILSNEKIKQSINAAASEALEKIQELLAKDHKAIKFSDLITVSRNFAQKSGLLTNKEVISTIKEIEKTDGHASMIMLGNAVFSDIPFPESRELKISNTPAHLL